MWVCIFQLRQLQNRQDQLLSMKKEAELRLQQAQARDNQGESNRVSYTHYRPRTATPNSQETTTPDSVETTTLDSIETTTVELVETITLSSVETTTLNSIETATRN